MHKKSNDQIYQPVTTVSREYFVCECVCFVTTTAVKPYGIPLPGIPLPHLVVVHLAAWTYMCPCAHALRTDLALPVLLPRLLPLCLAYRRFFRANRRAPRSHPHTSARLASPQWYGAYTTKANPQTARGDPGRWRFVMQPFGAQSYCRPCSAWKDSRCSVQRV
eukprot:7382859-Prymnesium_polylepis.1